MKIKHCLCSALFLFCLACSSFAIAQVVSETEEESSLDGFYHPLTGTAYTMDGLGEPVTELGGIHVLLAKGSEATVNSFGTEALLVISGAMAGSGGGSVLTPPDRVIASHDGAGGLQSSGGIIFEETIERWICGEESIVDDVVDDATVVIEDTTVVADDTTVVVDSTTVVADGTTDVVDNTTDGIDDGNSGPMLIEFIEEMNFVSGSGLFAGLVEGRLYFKRRMNQCTGKSEYELIAGAGGLSFSPDAVGVGRVLDRLVDPDPIEPTEPVDPIEPIEPTDPVGPIEPVEPTDPF